MSYYHLVVIGKDKRKSNMTNESSLKEINKISKEYLSKEDFSVNGKRFNYDEVSEFSVYESTDTVEEIICYLDSNVESGIVFAYDVYSALKEGSYSNNISNQVLSKRRVKTDSKSKKVKNKNVFIVYGRDDILLNEVSLFLLKLGLHPIIISDKPDKGRTILTKIKESVEECSYSIVLFTPDDKGSLATETEKTNFRARENVLIELGYVIAKLGSEKVSVLKKGETNIPSDIQGLSLVLREEAEWKHHLVRNMKEVFKDISSDQI